MRLKLRPLPEFPGYSAGNDGHIYSHRRGQFRRLKPYMNSGNGYYCVSLYRDDRKVYRRPDGRAFRLPVIRSIHTLVASAWLPPRPTPAHTIDHRDENKANCRPSNLRWLTRKRNYRTFINNHPLYFAGEGNTQHKLTNDDVYEIRRTREVPASCAASYYGVSDKTIYRIRAGRSWRHLLGRAA